MHRYQLCIQSMNRLKRHTVITVYYRVKDEEKTVDNWEIIEWLIDVHICWYNISAVSSPTMLSYCNIFGMSEHHPSNRDMKECVFTYKSRVERKTRVYAKHFLIRYTSFTIKTPKMLVPALCIVSFEVTVVSNPYFHHCWASNVVATRAMRAKDSWLICHKDISLHFRHYKHAIDQIITKRPQMDVKVVRSSVTKRQFGMQASPNLYQRGTIQNAISFTNIGSY